MAEIGYLSVNVLLSLEESYRSCGVNDTPLQLPSTPAFHLHSNRDAWTNRQQAPNLLQRTRGQDETREMACSRHQRANSSGCDLCAKKFPLRRDMGSALEVLGLKQHCPSNSFVFAHSSSRGGGKDWWVYFVSDHLTAALLSVGSQVWKKMFNCFLNFV